MTALLSELTFKKQFSKCELQLIMRNAKDRRNEIIQIKLRESSKKSLVSQAQKNELSLFINVNRQFPLWNMNKLKIETLMSNEVKIREIEFINCP